MKAILIGITLLMGASAWGDPVGQQCEKLAHEIGAELNAGMSWDHANAVIIDPPFLIATANCEDSSFAGESAATDMMTQMARLDHLTNNPPPPTMAQKLNMVRAAREALKRDAP